jgi:hypothetical protein
MAFLCRCFRVDKAEAIPLAPRTIATPTLALLPDLQANFIGNDRLCDACQYWDNTQDVCTFMKQEDLKTRRTSLANMLQRRSCMVCQVIASAVQTKAKLLGWPITDTRRIQVVKGGAFETGPAMKAVQKAQERLEHSHKSMKCVLYLDMYNNKDPEEADFAKRLSWHWWPAPSLGLQLLLQYDGNPVRLANVKLWEDEYIDMKVMKRWISNCESQHSGRCQEKITQSLPAHFKLINVDELRVCDAPDGQRFVALSYMWSVHEQGKDLQLVQSNVDQLSQPGGLVLQQLPNTISDAVLLCRDLGEQWLWVDRFCIVQDDAITKGTQINAMDIIYGMAVFTLVAAVDPAKATGLPGVRGRPRASFLENDTRLFHAEAPHIDLNFFVTVDGSTWNTRGWTFQERVLSKRCIYITNYQAYFTCPKLLIQEELGEYSQGDKYTISPPSHFSVPHIYKLANEASYLDCACHYTSRNLSFGSDIEKAFTGVSNVLVAAMGTAFLFCLPEKHFTTSLLWHSIAHPTTRRKDAADIPSWSWAGWSGAISYNGCFSTNVIAKDIGTLVTFQIAMGDQGLRRLDIEERWFGVDIDFSNCPVLEDTRHRYVPDCQTTEEIWRDCPQSPWESRSRLDLDRSARQLAVEYPGSLVFNTTIAALALRPSAMPNKDLNTVSLELLSPDQEQIGDIQLDRAWMNEKVDLQQDQMFIVLCAGILPKSKRRELFHTQQWEERDLDKSPWLLVVMMVQQHDGVSERLGLGYVEARLWKNARPEWQTIVLV